MNLKIHERENVKTEKPKNNPNSRIRDGFLVFQFFSFLVFWFLSSGSGWAEPRQIFVGVFREGAPRNMSYISNFEKQAGKKPAMIMWYQDWAQVFPKEAAQNVINYGAVPHIVWEPWYWGNKNQVKLKDIISGKWDNYIRSWAKDIKEWGHPIFLRYGHEFNIEGYPWGIINNDKDPEIYVKAFQHVVDIFKKEKTANAKFVWCFMNYSYPDELWNNWQRAYPGDKYVDWIGIDGYNWGDTQSWSNWEPFKYLFRDQARLARRLWPDKPIMIAEFASADTGGDKAAWIREIPGYLKSSMRDIDAVIWFDLSKETDWRINSSKKSLEAFQEIMKDPVFSSSGEALVKFRVASEEKKKKIAVAPKAKRGVKIDGKLSDWDKTYPVSMLNEAFLKEGLNWAGPEDLSGSAYLMWDETNLYLAAEIADKIPLINKKTRQDVWNGDAVEVVLGLDKEADPKRTSYGRGDYQFGFGAGDGKGNKPSIWNWQRRRSPKDSEISVVKNGLGYILEAKIPWEFFRGVVPRSAMRIGFDIAFDDADKTGERERQFVWNGDYYFYHDPSVWGILELR